MPTGSPARCSRTTWPGCSSRTTRPPPGPFPVDDPGLLRRLPPPRLAGRPGPGATIYVDELPFHHQDLARFIPEFVMAQIESDAALAQIPTTTRHLLVLIIETGLRGGTPAIWCSTLSSATPPAGHAFASTPPRSRTTRSLSATAAQIGPNKTTSESSIPPAAPGCSQGWPTTTTAPSPTRTPTSACSCARCERIGLHDQAGQPSR